MDTLATFHRLYAPTLAWWFPAAGLALSALGLLFVHFSRRTLFSLIFLGFSCIWVLAASALVGSSYLRFHRAATDPNTPQVVGTVTNFVADPPGGHGDESFDVAGVHFAYAYYTVTGAYNRSTPHGGVLRDGMHVRIRYLPEGRDNLIVSIETTDR